MSAGVRFLPVKWRHWQGQFPSYHKWIPLSSSSLSSMPAPWFICHHSYPESLVHEYAHEIIGKLFHSHAVVSHFPRISLHLWSRNQAEAGVCVCVCEHSCVCVYRNGKKDVCKNRHYVYVDRVFLSKWREGNGFIEPAKGDLQSSGELPFYLQMKKLRHGRPTVSWRGQLPRIGNYIQFGGRGGGGCPS